MKLIDNWKDVCARAHSMWAFYLSLLCLIAPDALYWFWQVDTNPRVWWFGGVALLFYGIVFRLVNQKIEDNA